MEDVLAASHVEAEGAFEYDRRPALPVVFGSPERSIVGFYHAPHATDGPSSDLAVVFCNPLGYEAMSVHRTYRHLAERLSAQGFPTLRFDYEGTGDSAGRFEDSVRLRAWIDNVESAAGEIRARSGAQRLALFGIRLGATLAALAAAEIANVEALILWAPIVSGRAHARELRAFDMLKRPRGSMPAPKDHAAGGGVEVGGYVIGRAVLDDLAAIDLLGERLGDPGTRSLLLSRGEQAAVDELHLREKMTAKGIDVRLLPNSGYPKMMRDDPYETVVPTGSLDAIVRWVCEREYPRLPMTPSEDAGRTSLSVAADGGPATLTETPLLFGDGGRLVGILTDPEAPAPRGRPAFVFLNVGANHHVGPHRMNVELARELASLGYTAFRMDAAGLGDSPAGPGRRENRIYTMDSIADVEAAMCLLGQMRNAERFVLVGLCSGAYLAYHTAVKHPSVVGQLLLSPYAFEWKEGDAVAPKPRKPHRSARFYVRAMGDRKVWQRALRGDVDPRGMASAIVERVTTALRTAIAAALARVQGELAPRNAVENAFRTMCERGVETLMVLSFDDGGVDMVADYLGTDARKMQGRKNFDFKILEGTDHAFQTVSSQRILRGEVTRYAQSRFP